MLTVDDITRTVPLTDAQLAADRAKIVAMYAEHGEAIDAFTCDDCGARFTCTLVFDAYNTDGDCLAEK